MPYKRLKEYLASLIEQNGGNAGRVCGQRSENENKLAELMEQATILRRQWLTRN